MAPRRNRSTKRKPPTFVVSRRTQAMAQALLPLRALSLSDSGRRALLAGQVQPRSKRSA